MVKALNRVEIDLYWRKLDKEYLLLYFESCLVDNHGLVEGKRMDKKAFKIAKQMASEGFIAFGRRPFDDIKKSVNPGFTHWVRFTEDAWNIAHGLRRRKAERHNKTIVAE